MQKMMELPVFGTTASLFNDAGIQNLFMHLIKLVDERAGSNLLSEMKLPAIKEHWEKSIIPPSRVRYLGKFMRALQNIINWWKIRVKLLPRSTNYRRTGRNEKGKYHEFPGGRAGKAK